MTLTTEINRIERINQSLRISCAGLDGSALAQFNQLHTRGPDGRFGSKSTGVAAILIPRLVVSTVKTIGKFRQPEIDEVKAAYEKLGKDLVAQVEQAKNIFNPERYAKIGATVDEYMKSFIKAATLENIRDQERAVTKLVKDLPPLLDPVIESLTAPAKALLTTFAMAAFLPLAAGHLIVGRKIEERVLKVAKDFVSTIKQVADLTRQRFQAFHLKKHPKAAIIDNNPVNTPIDASFHPPRTRRVPRYPPPGRLLYGLFARRSH